MENPRIAGLAFGALKQQKLTWSIAAFVGLFLILIGHAPILSVLAGCLLAVGLAALRSVPALKAKKVAVREGK